MEIRELGGGVSNRVFLVEEPAGRYVIKQSLDRLRVADEWLADRSRIFRERQSLQDAARLLPTGAVPRVLWTDDANFRFAMSAAPPEAETWKSQLLDGRLDPAIAASVGVLLGLLIRHTWGDPAMERLYGDQTAFDQLRLDPYYRTIASRHPEVAGCVQELLAASGARRVSLVHGDWSPKNFLVHAGVVMVIDFEVVHYGDPAFDAAFCLNHFLLKCFYKPEHRAGYLELARVFYAWLEGLLPPAALPWFEAATCSHLGCLLLARIDGKSPVEYLTAEPVREKVRRIAVRLILDRVESLEEFFRRI
jgi:5-methylthioribose kinase